MIPEKDFTEPPDKEDRLLVIGFDAKPKGKNPLEMRKTPKNQRKLPVRSPSPIYQPSKKLDLRKKKVPRQFEEESEPVVLETEFLTPNYTPAGLVEGPKNTDLLIADEMPNLQEFAKRKLRRNV
jgi:hypothetical protein